MIDPIPKQDLQLPPMADAASFNLQVTVDGFIALLSNKEYIALREKYDRGQLSFWGHIKEIEVRALGFSITQ